MKRRHFMQFAGSALGAIALSQFELEQRAIRYARVLAQDTPRKLALLVGINDYPVGDVLYGPTVDVELQKQLLMHRFKFSSADILTLKNEQAKREDILSAFETHLIAQARPGDVVMFHFSGHGARVRDPDCDAPDCRNTTLVPYDFSQTTESGVVQDIMGHTLFLLMSKVNTDNMTVVLDCCYSGGGKRGNVIMRSHTTDTEIRTGQAPAIAPNEREYQQRLLDDLGWTEDEFRQKRRAGVARGVVISSAKRDQLSADYPFEGFYAGAFTYLMTKYLWQQAEDRPVQQAITQITRSTTRLSQHFQEPEYEYAADALVQDTPIYQVRHSTPPAEAVITEYLDNNRVKLWLGGLDAQSLSAFDNGAVFTVVDGNGNPQGEVQQDSPRDGLASEGRLLSQTRGTAATDSIFLQERVRCVPTDIKLSVGLDSSLENDEAIAAQQLSQIDFLEVHTTQAGKGVQCLFGRMTSANQQNLSDFGIANLPETGSWCIFTPMLEPIPGASRPGSESVEQAIARLQPKFKSLLVGRMLRLLLNPDTSRLNVDISVEQLSSEGTAERSVSRGTTRSGGASEIIIPTLSGKAIEQIELNRQIQIRFQNKEQQDLYISLLVIDAEGTVEVLFPFNWDAPEDDALVAAGRTIELPILRATEPTGLTELILIASTHSLRRALRTMQRAAPRTRGFVPITEPGEIMENLFADLSGTRSGTNASSEGAACSMDTTQLAVVSLTYEVVPPSSSPLQG
ncbi:caspase family protein [Leptolyngbya sp. FACHB-541]|uniref:caspase family protein n=1 Tax=Leptolyngbya sp. FACHB-541 TaxID=2692810 RepID=UPI0016828804|nr:caspase family protein [Leptolyngbya sp. FACHB-541]MBD2001428.1 caspase family protein [Leptolyngbya sp. FACHB-541]